ncbi:ester cyclase [Sphaerisporangium rhizosphaerae]|uniref:Ester cyclase n=1 Tax=Sphaerisporangium rhizosphaerae TaxID=2269375 RepID=A0ABW2PBG0_9ACTN
MSEQATPKNLPVRIRATGPEEVRRLTAMIRQALPDATFSVQERVEDDKGSVAVVVTARGTHTGQVGNYAPTGEPATVVIVSSLATRPRAE